MLIRREEKSRLAMSTLGAALLKLGRGSPVLGAGEICAVKGRLMLVKQDQPPTSLNPSYRIL